MAPYSFSLHYYRGRPIFCATDFDTIAHELAYGSTSSLRIIIKLRTEEFVLYVYANLTFSAFGMRAYL